jgi:hypothetical protein
LGDHFNCDAETVRTELKAAAHEARGQQQGTPGG